MASVLNRPSQAVMLRPGMTAHGLFEHPAIPAGHALRRHIVYRLRRPGIPAARRGREVEPY
ncbi:MAG TPA: hypothetical protein VMI33_19685 [Streptosporangiaceae bacterium]|nr:hypothetical protein [Streptosporangiaceae bacterium]